jgi:PAS domain S-box-containing protein
MVKAQIPLPAAHRVASATNVILDGHGTIRFCGNPRLFGGDRQEIDGQPIGNFIPKLALPRVRPGKGEPVGEIDDAPTPWHRHSLHATGGRSIEVEVSLRLLALDRQVAILVLLRLPQDERTPPRGMAALLDRAASDAKATYVIDDEGRIVFVNGALERLTGYSSDEICGMTPLALRRDSDARDLCREVWTTLLSGHTLRGVFMNRTKNGQVYREAQCIRPFVGDDGMISHFVATCRNLDGDCAVASSLEPGRASLP